MMRLVLFSSLSFIATTFFVALFSRLSLRVGLLDYPNRRKVHARPVPLCGGISMAAGFFASGVAVSGMGGLRGYFIGSLVILFTGLADDLLDLKPLWKLLSQGVAVLIAAKLDNAVLWSFGDVLGTGGLELGRLALPLTVFCSVGAINAINMIDGLDGLAGGISAMAFACFMGFSYFAAKADLLLLCGALLGASAAFLRHNKYPSKIFMGNAGSMFLGYSLAYLAIKLARDAAISPVTVLLVLALPVGDALIVITKRLMRRRNPFRADKSHLHHLLFRFGMEKDQAVRLILGANLLFCLAALFGAVFGVPDYRLFSLFFAYVACGFAVSFHVRKFYGIQLRARRNRAPAGQKYRDKAA